MSDLEFVDHIGHADHSSHVDDGSGHSANDALLRHAATDPIDPAQVLPMPIAAAPDQALAMQHAKPNRSRARAKPNAPANVHLQTDDAAPEPPRDLGRFDAHASSVAGQTNEPAKPGLIPDGCAAAPGDDPSSIDHHSFAVVGQPHDQANVQSSSTEVAPDQPDPAVGLLIELWRQRQDLRRAEGRLDLQCQAICRRVVGGDKEAAGKLWAAINTGKSDNGPLLLVLSPYTTAIASLDESASNLEKQLIKLVRPMSLWKGWAASVRGMAELSFAGMIGEAARMPGDYKSVAAVWKRFGLAVIDGGRQRLIAGAEASALHGYSPQRRAYAYTLSTNLMRSQREGDCYRALYDKRKAYELANELPKGHAHNRALRVMVKALLRDAWIADRAQRRP